jgi:hypothetical protein
MEVCAQLIKAHKSCPNPVVLSAPFSQEPPTGAGNDNTGELFEGESGEEDEEDVSEETAYVGMGE